MYLIITKVKFVAFSKFCNVTLNNSYDEAKVLYIILGKSFYAII